MLIGTLSFLYLICVLFSLIFSISNRLIPFLKITVLHCASLPPFNFHILMVSVASNICVFTSTVKLYYSYSILRPKITEILL